MGKVGVGTNQPATLLDVNGDATVRGALAVSGGISGSGASLSGLDATNLSSGTVPLARLTGITSNQMDSTTDAAYRNAPPGVTNHAELSNLSYAASGHTGFQPAGDYLTNGQTGVTLSGTISGTGAGLTGLDAGNLSTGTVALGRLSGITTNQMAEVERIRVDQAVTNGQTNVTLSGTFSGNGDNLSSLNASNLSSGAVPLSRLSGITTNEMAAAEREKLAAAQDAAQVATTVAGILSTNVAADSAKLGGKDASCFVVDDGTAHWNNDENGGGHSSTNWYEIVAMYGIFGGLYVDGGEVHMGDGGTGGGNVYMDGGYLYMSNSASAYFYGGEIGGMHAAKVGGGYLDLGSSLGLMMGGGAGSGGQAIRMEGGYLAMNSGGGLGGGNLYMDSGFLYMSNNMSAYLCPSDQIMGLKS
jgi:hypothetical protein